ncbi:MAG: BglG family transcription antiterminator [Lachnospiraceae bacterium]|nr:BglG family transcription antiterminator [Lachnospiraceae bacterium]
MLNQRQIEILLEFCNHPDELLTASFFANKLNVSLRTVQGDMKAIRQELEDESCATLLSKASKGSCIQVEDYDEFSAFINSLYQQYTTVSLSYPTSRLSKILLLLLSRHRAVSISEMQEKFFVSRSTLLNDLKKVSEILEKYQLELLRSSNKVMIDGYEINKRRCLSKQDLYLAHIKNDQGVTYIDERQIAKIKNILTDVFVEQKYHIMDTDFNNTILFLNIMICRIGDGFYIQPNEIDIVENLGREYEISKALFERISRRFFIKVTDEEVKYFSLYLRGQGNSQDSDTITPEMDQFVLESLELIKENFGVNLSSNVNLRVTLALHCMSLEIRLKYDMQMKNDMLEYIRETFPLGYDMATYFAFMLNQKYEKRVSEDEIALLAVHFYSSMMELNNQTDKIKILVISSMKNSMTLLMKQTLLRWFPEHVSTVDFVNEVNVTEEMLDEYEIFLTTEKGKFFTMGLAMYVDPFPSQQDYMNIKLNIDGFKNMEDILAIFHPELFSNVLKIKKEEALTIICDQATEYFGLEELHYQVHQRENLGSTFFSKQIAVPHPLYAVSSDTFISVLVSKYPIIWDEENNEVNLVMLMHVGKNNTQAFQLWEYISKIFADKGLVEKLVANPTYDKFIQLLKETLETGIHNNTI